MTKAKSFDPNDMPILELDASGTTRFEASRYLDTPEAISAYLSSSLDTGNPESFLKALGEVARARGVNKLAADAGVNRESLYKALRPGAKPRYDTVLKLMSAVGVEMTVKPAARQAAVAKPRKVATSAQVKTSAVGKTDDHATA